MFTPDITVRALRAMREKFGARVYGRYGFADAFNPNDGWVNPDVIGINVGITLLSAENLRSGNVWRWFMSNREIPRAMRRVGLVRKNERRRRDINAPRAGKYGSPMGQARRREGRASGLARRVPAARRRA